MSKQLTLTTPSLAVGRQFVLYRHKDISGVSGEGVVAEGIVFANGQVALRWYAKTSNMRKKIVRQRTEDNSFRFQGSISIFQSIDEIIEIHGHQGNTEALYLDEMAGVAASNRIYDPPWTKDHLVKVVSKIVKRVVAAAKMFEKDNPAKVFGKAIGTFVGMIRIAEKKAYRRGWNDSLVQSKLGDANGI